MGRPNAAPGSGAASLDEKTRNAGMAAWQKWMVDHQANIVGMGGPLGSTKKTSAAGVSDMRNAVVGYVVVKADSHEAAAKMFEGHPHFSIFPGDSVEIMEQLPIPGA
ncbi:MAG: hypothetical protein GC155_03195 [Alphaproteobacteria bacterium]|nr:hypothetical protein [Alphaproteobacteria bacterium]